MKTCRDCKHFSLRPCCGAFDCALQHFELVRPDEAVADIDDYVDEFQRKHAATCDDYEIE
jgi:hypothetical protein